MKLAIMQPYFFPYIGYFQLINSVELFIVYDNIKYTKKGWINRNRFLVNGKDMLFSLPLKSDSDTLDVVERELSSDFKPAKLLQQISGAYHRAPHFRQTLPLIEEILLYKDKNLFKFLHQSIVKTCAHLSIKTEIRISSSVPIDHGLKSKDKVIALCQAVDADTYINAIGGKELYEPQEFRQQGVALKFIKSRPFDYTQFDHAFIPWLSIIDVMMFNPLEQIQEELRDGYTLI